MQTLFGFELGNYYRSVNPLSLQTEFPRPSSSYISHHADPIRQWQSKLTNQGRSCPIRIHCRTWDLVGSRRSVFLEREEVISSLIVLLWILHHHFNIACIGCMSTTTIHLPGTYAKHSWVNDYEVHSKQHATLMLWLQCMVWQLLPLIPMDDPSRPECISLV